MVVEIKEFGSAEEIEKALEKEFPKEKDSGRIPTQTR